MTPDYPDDTLQAMALWLARRMDRVRQHPAAADIVAEITDAVRAATRAIDRPAQRVYAGPCDCGHGELLSWPGRTLAHCDHCGTAYGIAERQEWMRSRLAAHLVTAHEAAIMLAGIGIHVSDGTIRMWHHRGQLEPHFPDGVAHPRYQLGDVAARAVARDTRAGLAA